VEEIKKCNTYCPVHNWITQEIERINETLWNLQCKRHDIRLDRLEAEMHEQKRSVEEVKKTIWVWKGGLILAAFMGSIAGAALVNILLNVSRR
jgi:hypothetical protein